jgi:hypothetical protein
MKDHWAEFGPPAYVAIAMYMGLIKPGQKRKNFQGDKKEEPGNFDELIAMFANTGGVIT